MSDDVPGIPMRLTAAAVVGATGGRLLAGRADVELAGVSIDSRTIGRGDLYIAIQGRRVDGHLFVDAALDAGACGAVVSETPAAGTLARVGERPLVVVADTTRALQDFARDVRRRSGARVVAVTGSAGKTSTKETAATFIAACHRVMRSTGNLNNHIGLPLSLLELRHGAEVAVVELGMNHAGEISRLVAVAEPDVRVWTNVAEVHLEYFSSVDAIAEAKAEVLEGATPATVLVANADDDRVMRHARGFAGRLVTFGTRADATVRASEIEDRGLGGTRAVVATPRGTMRLEVPLIGRGSLFNVLAAAAVALQFDVPLDAVEERSRALRPTTHRGAVLRLAGGVTVVDDTYNANPLAVQGVLAVVARETGSARRVAVLGEMLELGKGSRELHEACGRAAAAAGLSLLVTVGGAPARALGEAAVRAGMPASAVRHAETSAEAAAIAAAGVRPGDLVVVKGSRGVGTEVVVERLAAQFA